MKILTFEYRDTEPSYFGAIRARRERRGHLPSFGKLLDAFREVGGPEP